jgi:predicted DNA-binding protein
MCLIRLQPETHKRIQEYAEAAGIPVERAASEAIDKWMDATGDLVMVMMRRRLQQSNRKPVNTQPVIMEPTLEMVAP